MFNRGIRGAITVDDNSKEAIEAVINPEISDNYYFVASAVCGGSPRKRKRSSTQSFDAILSDKRSPILSVA